LHQRAARRGPRHNGQRAAATSDEAGGQAGCGSADTSDISMVLGFIALFCPALGLIFGIVGLVKTRDPRPGEKAFRG